MTRAHTSIQKAVDLGIVVRYTTILCSGSTKLLLILAAYTDIILCAEGILHDCCLISHKSNIKIILFLEGPVFLEDIWYLV